MQTCNALARLYNCPGCQQETQCAALPSQGHRSAVSSGGHRGLGTLDTSESLGHLAFLARPLARPFWTEAHQIKYQCPLVRSSMVSISAQFFCMVCLETYVRIMSLEQRPLGLIGVWRIKTRQRVYTGGYKPSTVNTTSS